MSIAIQCLSQFAANVRTAGQRYFDRGAVNLEYRGDGQFRLAVSENTGLIRRVAIAWSKTEDDTLSCASWVNPGNIGILITSE